MNENLRNQNVELLSIIEGQKQILKMRSEEVVQLQKEIEWMKQGRLPSNSPALLDEIDRLKQTIERILERARSALETKS